jgi:anti-sigma-K factor RskA
MSAAEHGRWSEELAAYMLGALEPDGEAAMEAHLEACASCQQDARWLRPAVDVIPESVEQIEPPPRLRERLLAEVRAGAEVAGRTGEAESKRPGGFSLPNFFMRPAVALGVVALLVAAIVGYTLGGGGDGDATTTVEARAGEGLKAMVEHTGDEGTLQMTGLEQAPARRVYQAWVQHGNRLQPASVFDAREDGTADVAIPHGLHDADAVMVTVEPRGGSRQPTSSPVVNLALSG